MTGCIVGWAHSKFGRHDDRDVESLIVEAELARASRSAVRDLQKYGEIDRATERALRRTRYTPDQVLGDWFPSDPMPSAG